MSALCRIPEGFRVMLHFRIADLGYRTQRSRLENVGIWAADFSRMSLQNLTIYEGLGIFRTEFWDFSSCRILIRLAFFLGLSYWCPWILNNQVCFLTTDCWTLSCGQQNQSMERVGKQMADSCAWINCRHRRKMTKTLGHTEGKPDASHQLMGQTIMVRPSTFVGHTEKKRRVVPAPCNWKWTETKPWHTPRKYQKRRMWPPHVPNAQLLRLIRR